MSRRFQFSLRALLVVMPLAMLLVGTFLGGVRFERERARRQQEAENQAPRADCWPSP
ncbi:MAG: hypothetical protein ACREHD_18395 [Pirellulales bacterium]